MPHALKSRRIRKVDGSRRHARCRRARCCLSLSLGWHRLRRRGGLRRRNRLRCRCGPRRGHGLRCRSRSRNRRRGRRRLDRGVGLLHALHRSRRLHRASSDRCCLRPLRIRKLLLHRSEINKMEAKLKEKGLTLVPIKVYFKDSLVKVEIGMARGKKLYDKRQDIAKKDQRREAERDFKVKNLY